MTHWETEERCNSPSQRADELRREQDQMLDEYHAMEERVTEPEDKCDRLRKALRGLVETTAPGEHLKRLAEAERLLQEAGDEQ